jgi:hypothetical protein
MQVFLAAPYPGTELYEQATLNGWFAKKDKAALVETDGFQQSSLEYPGLSKEEIFESVERFYHRYYLHPKPILRIIKTCSRTRMSACGGSGRVMSFSSRWHNAGPTWQLPKLLQREGYVPPWRDQEHGATAE